jgi:hypothetical protein
MLLLAAILHTLFTDRSLVVAFLTVLGTVGIVLWMRLLRRPGKPMNALDLLAGLALWDLLAMPLMRGVWAFEGLIQPAPNTIYPTVFSEPASLKMVVFSVSLALVGVLLTGGRVPEHFFPLRGKWLRSFLAAVSLLLLAWSGDGATYIPQMLQSLIAGLWVPPHLEDLEQGWISITVLAAALPIMIGGTWRVWSLMVTGGLKRGGGTSATAASRGAAEHAAPGGDRALLCSGTERSSSSFRKRCRYAGAKHAFQTLV